MECGPARGAVYLVSGVLATASGYAATKVSIASFAYAATTAPTVVGAAAGVAGGVAFGAMAVYDVHLAADSFRRAVRDYRCE